MIISLVDNIIFTIMKKLDTRAIKNSDDPPSIVTVLPTSVGLEGRSLSVISPPLEVGFLELYLSSEVLLFGLTMSIQLKINLGDQYSINNR